MTDLEQSTEAIQTPVTPGGMLTQARERAGITQEQVAKDLHMTLTKVRSIENDQCLRLNTDTFIRGYLRAYANYLKLDSAPVIAAYQQYAAEQGLVAEPQYIAPKDAPAKKLWVFVIALVFLLAGLWLISVWFFDNQAERPVAAPSAMGPQSSIPITSGPQSLPVVPIVADQASEMVNSEEDAPADSEAPALTTESDIAIEQTSVVSTEKALDKLELSFVEECWLEVSDAQGDVLATELQRPGSRVSLLGIAPFSVKLGNAPAVRVILNGVEIAIDTAGSKVVTVSVGE